MNDVLPAEIGAWQYFEACTRELLAAYGYEEIRVPVVEHTELFKRAIGEFTDVVDKEMYTFVDRGGDSLTLRPEATAGIVRALISNGLLRGATPQALVPRTDVPPRDAAGGPLPPVLPGRRRGGRLRRSGRRCGAHRADTRACGSGSESRGLKLEINSLGTPESRRDVPRAAGRLLPRARSAARCRQPAPPRGQSAAHPRQQEPAACRS